MFSHKSQLLQYIIKGKDQEALDIMNRTLIPKLKKYIISNRGDKTDVKDVFQEVVYITYKKIKLEGFRPEGDLVNYMFVIGKNYWIAKAVKEQKNSDIEEYSEKLFTEATININSLISEERNNACIEIMNSIGDQCRELLNLRIYEEMDLNEIAQKLGMSNTDVVKSTIYRCKMKLKEKIMKNKGLLQLLDIKL